MIIIFGFLFGIMLIVYGFTRTEKNFVRSTNPRLKNVNVINKKEFVKAHKILFVFVGVYVIILGILIQKEILSTISIYYCFTIIFLLPVAVQFLIKNRYCKKDTKYD